LLQFRGRGDRVGAGRQADTVDAPLGHAVEQGGAQFVEQAHEVLGLRARAQREQQLPVHAQRPLAVGPARELEPRAGGGDGHHLLGVPGGEDLDLRELRQRATGPSSTCQIST